MFTSATQGLRFFLYLAALVIVPASVSVDAEAGPAFCGNHKAIIGKLAGRFNETRRMIGMSRKGDLVLEVYAADSRTFTVLLTTTKGHTCIMFAGHAVEFIEPGQAL